MNFVNNWSRPIELAAGAIACPLDLPDGTYRLCISDTAGGLLEVVDATVVSGAAALTRGLEGTAAQTWLSGSRITASVTAEMLESFAAARATWGGIAGSLADQTDLQAALNSKATSAQGAKADSAVQPDSLAEVATSGSYSDLASKPFIPAAPGDIGAGTAAQGALADTAVQPEALTAGLLLKVDKVAGYGLSQENYTPDEKAKLAALDGNLWKGEYTTLSALQAAHPTAAPGSSANVDAGAGDPVLRYIWDDNDSEWVAQAGSADPVTAAQVKTLYEANPDTNAFDDADKTKLDGIAGNATANPDTDSLSEGATNKWFTVARVLDAVLGGLNLATGTAVVSTDSVQVAIGKLQKQITDLASTVAGKQDALVSGTNIKTINGASVLGDGNLLVGGGSGMANPMTASGDLIVGGVSGSPSRLAIGLEGQTPVVRSGAIVYETLASGGHSTYKTAPIFSGAIDLSDEAVSTWLVELTENVTSILLPTAVTGEAISVLVIFTQDGTGSRTVSGWPTTIWEFGSAPTVSSTAGSMTSVPLLVLGSGAVIGVS